MEASRDCNSRDYSPTSPVSTGVNEGTEITLNQTAGNQSHLVDASCQTDFVKIDADLAELKRRMASDKAVQEPLTAESITATAQSVLMKSGWVYDPRTKTYFDYNTNLYYYPHTRLYYNYKNGCYYRYNQESQKYEFHYQLQSFKGHAHDLQEQNTIMRRITVKKQRLPNLKKLKRTIFEADLQFDTIKSETEENEESLNCVGGSCSLLSHRTAVTIERVENLSKIYRDEKGSNFEEHYTDSEIGTSLKRNRRYFVCRKCHHLIVPFCCCKRKIKTHGQNGNKRNRQYSSDTEIETLSTFNKKYVVCTECNNLAVPDCCATMDFWCEWPAKQPKKRKRTGKKQKRKRRKRSRYYSSSSSSMTEKENEIGPLKKEELTDQDHSITERNKVEYSFDIAAESVNDNGQEYNIIPCIRVMVTSSKTIDVGTLFVITCSGITIGSGENCGIRIEEYGVDENHATITYNQEQRNYFVTDLGSKSGTTLNSTTGHNPGVKAVLATPIAHKSILLIGSCIFVLHLHLGYETCDDCEPGQIKALLQHDQPSNTKFGAQNLQELRRSELKNLKKKYELHKDKYLQKQIPIGPQYTDRAAERRRTIGSDNPYEKDEMPTSFDTELADHNKGHQMLKKMGWSKGTSLGRSQKGITEPITPQGTGKGKEGLGYGLFKSGSKTG